MAKAPRLNEAVRSVKERLSYEEIQLALGECSIAAAGGTLFLSGAIRDNIMSMLDGAMSGMVSYEASMNHWQAAHAKINNNSISQPE
jgi:hypothetical protein